MPELVECAFDVKEDGKVCLVVVVCFGYFIV